MSTPRSAGEPFNYANADIIIRSSDMTDFRVHRVLLTELFQSFDDMLGAPMVGAGSAQATLDGLPVVVLTEPSEVLCHLLRLLYPIPFPDLSEDWSALLALCVALDKYIVKFYPLPIIHALRLAAKSSGGPGLGPIYALSCRHSSLNGLLMEVAKLALRNMSRLDDVPKDLLSGMSATQYHAFIDYQNRCRKVAEDATLPATIAAWIPIEEIPGGLGSSCSCPKARLAGFEWDAADSDIDGEEPELYKSDFSGYLVLWFAKYLIAVRSGFKTEVSGSVVTRFDNVVAAIHQTMKCAACSKSGVAQMVHFIEKLAAHVDEQIDAVPFHVT